MSKYVNPLANGVADFVLFSFSESGAYSLREWSAKYHVSDFPQLRSKVEEAVCLFQCACSVESANRILLLKALNDDSLSEYRKLLCRNIQALEQQRIRVLTFAEENGGIKKLNHLAKLLASLAQISDDKAKLLCMIDPIPTSNIAARALLALETGKWEILQLQLDQLIAELESTLRWVSTESKGGPNPELAKHRLATDLKRVLGQHQIPVTNTHEHGESGAWNSLLHLVLMELGKGNASGDYSAYMS